MRKSILFGLALILLSCSVLATDFTIGNILYLDFRRATSMATAVIDYSNHYNGTAWSSCALVSGTGVQFKDGCYINLPSINLTTVGTICAWDAPYNVTSGRGSILIKSNSGGGGQYQDISMELSPTKVQGYLGDGAAASQTLTAAGTTVAKAMRLDCISVNATHATTYHDGAPVVVDAVTTVPAGNPYNYSVGRFGEYGGYYYTGNMSAVMMWDVALGEMQIKELNASGIGFNPYVNDSAPITLKNIFNGTPEQKFTVLLNNTIDPAVGRATIASYPFKQDANDWVNNYHLTNVSGATLNSWGGYFVGTSGQLRTPVPNPVNLNLSEGFVMFSFYNASIGASATNGQSLLSIIFNETNVSSSNSVSLSIRNYTLGRNRVYFRMTANLSCDMTNADGYSSNVFDNGKHSLIGIYYSNGTMTLFYDGIFSNSTSFPTSCKTLFDSLNEASNNKYIYHAGGGGVHNRSIYQNGIIDISVLNSFATAEQFALYLNNSPDIIYKTIITTNGTVYMPNNATLNVTVYNITGSEGVYFNQSKQNWNTSVALQMYSWQSVLFINATQKITNILINLFNATGTSIGGSYFNASNSSGNVTLYLNAGTYNLTAKAAGYAFNSTMYNIVLSSLQQQWETMTFGYNELNITVKDYFTNATINTFTAQLNLNNSYFENVSTTTGTAKFYGINGTYNVTIFTAGYAPNHTMFLLNTSANLTFFIFTTNSIYFNFYDEVTKKQLANATIYCNVIGDDFAQNYSTTNGSLYIDSLTPQEYTIRAWGEAIMSDYDDRHYIHTMTNQSNTWIDMYLVNRSLTNYVEAAITVYDVDRKVVEGDIIKVLRYDITTNSYSIREIIRTNFEGVADVDLIKNEENYKFIIEHNGEVVKITSPTPIYSDTLAIQYSIGELYGEGYFAIRGIAQSLAFNNDTHKFTFTFSDPSNTMTEGCLAIYTVGSNVALNSSCTSGTAGTIILSLTAIANDTTYAAKALITLNGANQTIATLNVREPSAYINTSALGFFLCGLLTILIIILTYENLPIMISVAPLPLLIFSAINIVMVQIEVVFGLELACLVISFIISRKG